MQDFDPLLPETFDSAQAEYRELRTRCPVAHSDAWGGFWALMKHADVAAAAADSTTFITSKQNVVPAVAFTGRRPPLHLDPPEHTPYRRALSPLLTERKVAPLEPVIRDICISLLDAMAAKGGGDICEEFSARMPIRVFATWMNLPQEQIDSLAEVGRRYNIAVQSNDMLATKETSLLLYEMARALVADRKASPLDPAEDATSALLATRDIELHGRTIPAGEPIALVYASANRDEDVFEDAESFRLDRPNMKDSLHFGRGTHMCVGAALARLELVVALEEMMARLPQFDLAGEVVPTRFPEIGALSVPLRFG